MTTWKNWSTRLVRRFSIFIEQRILLSHAMQALKHIQDMSVFIEVPPSPKGPDLYIVTARVLEKSVRFPGKMRAASESNKAAAAPRTLKFVKHRVGLESMGVNTFGSDKAGSEKTSMSVVIISDIASPEGTSDRVP